MKELNIHIRSIFGSCLFWLCMAIEVVLFLTSTAAIIDDDTAISLFEVLFTLDRNISSGLIECSREYLYGVIPSMYAVVFMPVVCIAPGIFAYFEDNANGHYYFSQIRSSRKKRTITWLLAQMISAAVNVSLAYCVVALMISFLRPSIASYTAEIAGHLASSIKSGIVIKRLGSFFLFGAFFGVISMHLSRGLCDRQLLLATLFASVYLYSSIVYGMMRMYIERGDYNSYNRWAELLPETFMNILAASPLKLILFLVTMCVLSIYYIFRSTRCKTTLKKA